jgi:hypothetical protein
MIFCLPSQLLASVAVLRRVPPFEFRSRLRASRAVLRTSVSSPRVAYRVPTLLAAAAHGLFTRQHFSTPARQLFLLLRRGLRTLAFCGLERSRLFRVGAPSLLSASTPLAAFVLLFLRYFLLVFCVLICWFSSYSGCSGVRFVRVIRENCLFGVDVDFVFATARLQLLFHLLRCGWSGYSGCLCCSGFYGASGVLCSCTFSCSFLCPKSMLMRLGK